MTNEQKQRIEELRHSGIGYASIAATLELTKNQVSAYCRRNGLTGEMIPVEKDDIQRCKNCRKPINQIPGKKPIKFCSSACCQSWWNTHPNEVKRKPEATYSFVCACCKKPFAAYGNRHRKYCSHACYITDRFGGESHD